jgi:hypothetical protein
VQMMCQRGGGKLLASTSSGVPEWPLEKGENTTAKLG